MTGIVPAAGTPAAPAVTDGVDVDAVAAAARTCPAVDDLCPGPWGVVSYLPGRKVAGVRVASDHVMISVRGRWGVPVSELARQVRAAITRLVVPRRIDVAVADLAEATAEITAGVPRDEVSWWTTSSPAGMPGASSSARITPTTVATPPPSPRA
jgi:hypothetical protein